MTIAADTALEAAFSLSDRLTGAVASVDLVEGLATGCGFKGRHWDLPLHQHASRIHGVLGMIRSFQLAARAEVLAIEPAVDRVGSLSAREHRRDHHVGTRYAI